MRVIGIERKIEHTDIPSMRENNPQKENDQKNTRSGPAVGCEWGRGIEVGLILLFVANETVSQALSNPESSLSYSFRLP